MGRWPKKTHSPSLEVNKIEKGQKRVETGTRHLATEIKKIDVFFVVQFAKLMTKWIAAK